MKKRKRNFHQYIKSKKTDKYLERALHSVSISLRDSARYFLKSLKEFKPIDS